MGRTPQASARPDTARGLTCAQVAEWLGLHERTVSRLVFHVRRLAGLERGRAAQDAPMQLALF